MLNPQESEKSLKRFKDLMNDLAPNVVAPVSLLLVVVVDIITIIFTCDV